MKLCIAKCNEIECCQAERGGGESTDALATNRVDDCSVTVEETSLKEAVGASKTVGVNLEEVHEKGNYVFQKLINLNIVRLNLEQVNQQIL